MNIDHFRKQAKNLKSLFPELVEAHGNSLTLSQAQAAIAKTHGYPSWAAALAGSGADSNPRAKQASSGKVSSVEEAIRDGYQRSHARQIAAQLVQQGLDPHKPIPKGTRLGLSNRRAKQQRRIAALHARIGDLRREALHQATTTLVRSAEVLCLEDLNLQAMSRSMGRRAFRRSVADASLGELRRQLTYKAEWQGRTLSVVDRFYPSSKTCSTCGEVNAALKLEQHWTCACGAVHDRDVNAAKNLLREGLRVLEGAATPRSGAYARGEADAAGDSTPSPATARSTNRELISRPRKRSTPGTARKDRARAGAG